MRKRSKKKNKYLLGLIILPTVVLLFIIGFIIIREKVETKIFVQVEKELYETIENEQKENILQTKLTKSDDENIEILTYTIVDNEGDSIERFQSLAESYAEKIMPVASDISTKVVITPVIQNLQPNLEKYYFCGTIYKWDKNNKKWVEDKLDDSNSILIYALTNEPPTLTDLFGSEANLLSVYHCIQDKLLEEGQDLKSVLDLPLPDPNDTFDYYDDHVTLYFADNDLGLEGVDVYYKDIGAFLNPDFVSPNYITSFPASHQLEGGKKYVALTFDDGPSSKTTERILEILKEKDVIATFYMLGSNVEQYPEIAKSVVEAGHQIGSHSYSHSVLPKLTNEEIREEINKTQCIIYEATGVLPTTVRPPYGSIDQNTAYQIAMPLVMWSADSLDWESKNADSILSRVQSTIKNNDILLMHDIQEATVEALPRVIDYLRGKGYQFVTVDELLNETELPMTAYYSANSAAEIVDK